MSAKNKRLHEIELAVTPVCNLRCRHCSVAHDHLHAHELPFMKIKEIIAQAHELGATHMDLTGGEPTTRSDICTIVATAKQCGLSVKVLSNGTLLDRERLKKLQGAGMDALAISLDGSSWDIHARTRGTTEAEFNRALDTIRCAVNFGIPTKINTVASMHNIDDVPNITHIAITYGCYEHRICVLAPVGRGRELSREIIDDDVWVHFIYTAFDALLCDIDVYITCNALPFRLAKHCDRACLLEHPTQLLITSDGEIFPCIVAAFNKISLGNVFGEDIKEIWNAHGAWGHIKSRCSRFCMNQTIDKRHQVSICPRRRIHLNTILSIRKGA